VTLGLPLDESTALRHEDRRRHARRPIQAAAVATLGSDRAYVVVVGNSSMFIDALRARHPDLVVVPAASLDLGSPTLGL
jgi:zinc protease